MPLGSLWQPCFGKFDDFVWIGAKGRLWARKRDTFRSFGPPFWSILGAISKDFRRSLNTQSLVMPWMFLGYSLRIHHVFFRYSLRIP